MTNNDQPQDDSPGVLYVDLTLGFDHFGEPLLNMDFHVPEGGGVKLDQAEGMALHILNTVAQARANAMVSRKLMLDGKSPEEVMLFLRDVMMMPQ